MKNILKILFEYKTLSREQAKEVLSGISRGVYNESEITSFITVFLMRSITIAELQGFRDALLELAVKADLNGYDAIDIVGTGEMEKIRLIYPPSPASLWQVLDNQLSNMAIMAQPASVVLPT